MMFQMDPNSISKELDHSTAEVQGQIQGLCITGEITVTPHSNHILLDSLTTMEAHLQVANGWTARDTTKVQGES